MRRAVVLIGILLIGAALGGAAALVHDGHTYAGRIFPGISIQGVDVGGLLPREARARVLLATDMRGSRPFVLHLAGEDLTFTHAELGLRGAAGEAVQAAYAYGRAGPWWHRMGARLRAVRDRANLPLRYVIDEGALRGTLGGLARELEGQPEDAQVNVENGRVVITRPGRIGRVLDVAATAGRIASALDAGGREAEAVVTVAEPAFTTAEARELQAPLATFTTVMASNPDRTDNIALAAGFLRGVILAPGDVFSYNKTVGPRSSERGFKEAPVLIDDELVSGDGGGVCQVSSTLFNVALLADLEILARSNHTRPVAYLPLGRDATVAYDWLDLRFRNTTEHHVLLWAEVRGSRLTITAYGTPAPGKVVLIEVTDHQEVPAPDGTVTKNDPELISGQVVDREAQPGHRVKTWRVVTVNGEVVRRELIGGSYYRPVPRTIKVGTKKTRVSSRP